MRRTSEGFTLLELLIVMAVIAILVAVLVPNLAGARTRAQDSATLAYLRHCASALEFSRDVLGKLPHPSPATCEDTALGDYAQVRPDSVKQSRVTVTQNRTAYTIDAISQSGKAFAYDQGGFREVP